MTIFNEKQNQSEGKMKQLKAKDTIKKKTIWRLKFQPLVFDLSKERSETEALVKTPYILHHGISFYVAELYKTDHPVIAFLESTGKYERLKMVCYRKDSVIKENPYDLAFIGSFVYKEWIYSVFNIKS